MSSEKILVAEPDAVLRRAFVQLLERAGYITLEATDEDEAFALAQTELPAAIILDVFRPQMNGLSLVRRLCSTPATRAIRIVGVLDGATGSHRLPAEEVGCEILLLAPMDPCDVVESATELLMSCR